MRKNALEQVSKILREPGEFVDALVRDDDDVSMHDGVKPEYHARGVAELAVDSHTGPVDNSDGRVLAMTAVLSAVEIERNYWRRMYHSAADGRDREAMRANALERSMSFRLGRAFVLLARRPLRTSRLLLRAVLRRLVARLTQVLSNLRIVADGSRSVRAVTKSKLGVDSSVKRQVFRRAVLSEHLPVRLYVALSFDHESLRCLVRAAGQCALLTGSHVPLVVTDNSSFAMLRESGVVMEFIPGRQTWESHRGDVPWEHFLSLRLAQLVAEHQVERTFFVDQTTSQLSQVLALNAEADDQGD